MSFLQFQFRFVLEIVDSDPSVTHTAGHEFPLLGMEGDGRDIFRGCDFLDQLSGLRAGEEIRRLACCDGEGGIRRGVEFACSHHAVEFELGGARASA